MAASALNPLRWWRDWQAQRAEAFLRRSQADRWFLLAGFCGPDALSAPPVDLLNPLYPPADVFWADPFAWRRDGRHYVFFEECPFATRKGRISVLELDAEARPVGPAVPVIEEPYHLSYPFLFEFEGELYMVPEKKAVRRVDVYRCVEFPHRCVPVKTLIAGMRIVDATLFEWQGRWWMFCAVKLKWKGLRYDETLFAFHADSPLSSDWTPHPANPLLRDFSRGRPGGRIQRDGEGRLLRPSQDCVRHYGDGLNINEISLLTPTEYQERRIWHSSGEAAGGWHGMHHMDWHEGLMVMDAQSPLTPAFEEQA